MRLIRVTEKANVISAAEFHGNPDLDMTKMLAGLCQPSDVDSCWDIIFESGGRKHKLTKGDWVIAEADGTFSICRAAGFEAAYSRMASDEDA